MKTTLGPVIEWLYKATAGIRFKPDRKAVRAELEEHLEDKTMDLRRIFPELTEEEAWERAVSEMGDPMEIGRELARLHRPWLGCLWRVSQVVLGWPASPCCGAGWFFTAPSRWTTVRSFWSCGMRTACP